MVKYLFSRKIFDKAVKFYHEKYIEYRKELLERSNTNPLFGIEYASLTFDKFIDRLVSEAVTASPQFKKWLACYICKRGALSMRLEFNKKHPDQRENLQAFDDWICHKYKIKKEAQYGSSPHGNG